VIRRRVRARPLCVAVCGRDRASLFFGEGDHARDLVLSPWRHRGRCRRCAQRVLPIGWRSWSCCRRERFGTHRWVLFRSVDAAVVLLPVGHTADRRPSRVLRSCRRRMPLLRASTVRSCLHHRGGGWCWPSPVEALYATGALRRPPISRGGSPWFSPRDAELSWPGRVDPRQPRRGAIRSPAGARWRRFRLVVLARWPPSSRPSGDLRCVLHVPAGDGAGLLPHLRAAYVHTGSGESTSRDQLAAMGYV